MCIISNVEIWLCAWVLSQFSCVPLFATPWTVTCQALLSVGFSRQEYWSGLPCPPLGDLLDPGVEPPLKNLSLAGRFFTTRVPWEAQKYDYWWMSNMIQCMMSDGDVSLGTTEDEMAGWHHWLDGREFEWTPGVGDGQGGLACCDSWGHKESDTTEQLNWTELNTILKYYGRKRVKFSNEL